MLRKLGHVTKDGVVTLKGRAACEISTGDELLTTELMFNGVFNSLDRHQLVALISCLVPVERSNVSQCLPVLSIRVFVVSYAQLQDWKLVLDSVHPGSAAVGAARDVISTPVGAARAQADQTVQSGSGSDPGNV